jgi:S1-C subfamily serine protease
MTLLCLASVLWLLAAGAPPATAVEREDLVRALKATVQVLVPDDNNDLYSTGSGTILDAAAGLILTNFHVIGDPDTGEYFNDEGLALIGIMPADLKGAPVVKFVARVTRADPELDLAVLKVIGTPGNLGAALPKNLGLTAIERGDSDDLLPGDHLAVLGYPGLGGSTVTYTEGVVSGFLDEDRDGIYEWIKTDTEVNPGNSGGLAIDTAGDFIGVPTAGYSRADVAGKISLIRPGALALQFYESAALGGDRAAAKGETARAATGSRADFGTITFAASITDDGQPQDPGNTFVDPQTVYAFFPVSGMRDGDPWHTRWLYEGEEVLAQDGEWDMGGIDSAWVNISHPAGLPEGEFTLELYIGERLVEQASFAVLARGGPARVKAIGVVGAVHDADNRRRAVAGALIVFLKPGVTIDEWSAADFAEDKVHGAGTSSRSGEFQLDAQVTPGERYGVVVLHDDYKPVAVDDYEIPADATDPYELDVALERK